MSKPSPRKQKKQKERQRANRTQRLAADHRQLLHARNFEYAQKYPGFRFDTTNGDPAFVELVKRAVAQINFDDRAVFQAWEAEVYQILKQRGSTAAFAALDGAAAVWKKDGVEGTELAEVHFSTNFGQAVFNLIGEAELLKYIPFNDVRFYQIGHDISVVFGSLLRTRAAGERSTTHARSPP